MTPVPQSISDRIWEIVLRAAERDPKVRALLFAKPGSGETSNPGHLLLSSPALAPSPIPAAHRGAGK